MIILPANIISKYGSIIVLLFIYSRQVVPGHVQPVGRPCGTWMHYATRDVKDMGQQMGNRSLEWNWPKEAMNEYRPKPRT